MKVLQTEITNALHSCIAIVEKKETQFSSPFHCHPELELVYIKSGTGKSIVGDTITNFNTGDITLIGSGLPHVWMTEKEPGSIQPLPPVSIVAYFNKDVFSENFYALKESRKLNELFLKAGRGLTICGATRQIIASKMEKLRRKTGLKKIIGLMDILHIISTSNELNYITHENSDTVLAGGNTDRLIQVYQYIADNFQKDISLQEIARVANLSPTAFCRLFKARAHKHFVEYMNEIRISAACRLLQETDLNISAICFDCGFKTISNFNKGFKKITGYSPKEYRQHMQVLQGSGMP